MKSKYLDEITKLLDQAYPRFAIEHRIEFKNCFGAIAGYVDGKIFISCGKFGVALKLPGEILDDLFKEKDVTHLQYFPKGHIKKEYAVLPRRITGNKRHFGELINRSIQFVKHN